MNEWAKTTQTAAKKWDDFYSADDKNLMHPDENIIRIFKGKYLELPKAGKLLDCGFGSGNNLVFLASLGYECYGLEVAESAIQKASSLMNKYNFPTEFALLNGIEHPYDDNFFDIVVSWNCLHYNGNRKDVDSTISELFRILKPGGTLLLSTISHEHGLVVNSDEISKNQFKVKSTYNLDNRAGVVVYSPGTQEDMLELFTDFENLQYGYTKSDLFDANNANACHLVYGKKPLQ